MFFSPKSFKPRIPVEKKLALIQNFLDSPDPSPFSQLAHRHSLNVTSFGRIIIDFLRRGVASLLKKKPWNFGKWTLPPDVEKYVLSQECLQKFVCLSLKERSEDLNRLFPDLHFTAGRLYGFYKQSGVSFRTIHLHPALSIHHDELKGVGRDFAIRVAEVLSQGATLYYLDETLFGLQGK